MGGCQAETGSAAAMAAGAAVDLLGGTPEQVGQAVAMTIKIVGVVCDPVAGLVEVPCIKRNAGAVTQALTAHKWPWLALPFYFRLMKQLTL
jgi:L-serine dehydratase